MMAAGWTNDAIAAEVRALLQRWFSLLTDVLIEAEQSGLSFGLFQPREVATLIGLQFMGGESLLLLGLESDRVPVRAALRRVGGLIRQAEEGVRP
jgi:hypothetical protein